LKVRQWISQDQLINLQLKMLHHAQQ